MGDPREPEPPALLKVPGRNPRIAARVVHGEALILTPHDSVLHTLNGVATRVWELMADHQDVDAIAAALATEYEVGETEARSDVLALIAQLQGAGILEA